MGRFGAGDRFCGGVPTIASRSRREGAWPVEISGDVGQVLVIIRTFNERENVETIVGRVRAAVPAVDVLVVDDNSPDGTGELADGLAAVDDQVKVVHRTAKDGLGRAYLAGFRWALE